MTDTERSNSEALEPGPTVRLVLLDPQDRMLVFRSGLEKTSGYLWYSAGVEPSRMRPGVI